MFEGQPLVQDLPTTPSGPPHTGTNLYTVTLDPINEGATPIPYASPFGPPTPEPHGSIAREKVPAFGEDVFSPYAAPAPHANGYRGAHARRRSSLGYPTLPNDAPLRSLSISPTSMSPRSNTLAQTFAPPGTEVLLWAYARLIGSFEFGEGIVPSAEIDSLRAKLRAGGVMGGGRMDISERAPAASGSPGGLTSGLFSSFFGSSPTALPQQPPSSGYLSSFFRSGSSTLSRSRLPNVNGRNGDGTGFSGSPFGGAAGASEDGLSLPTLETQPSMLAVDLNLAPGETRSCRCFHPSNELGHLPDIGAFVVLQIDFSSVLYSSSFCPAADVSWQRSQVCVHPSHRDISRIVSSESQLC